MIMKYLLSLIFAFLLIGCGQSQKTENRGNDTIPANLSQQVAPAAPTLNASRPDTMQQNTQAPAVNPYAKANIEVKPFVNNTGDAKGSWGYDIYIDKTMYIHQPSIPAVPGNMGFSTAAKSQKAGEFVAYKIKHNIMPPAVTSKELDSLGVLR